MPVTQKKVVKLISLLRKFSGHLDKNRNLVVHNNINQFDHMTKAEELEFLLNYFSTDLTGQNIIEPIIVEKYREGYLRWRKDMRWYSSFNRKLRSC